MEAESIIITKNSSTLDIWANVLELDNKFKKKRK